jgi:putative membrane protein
MRKAGEVMWYHGWGGWWLFMPRAMIAFWGGLLWVVFTVTRRPTGQLPGARDPEADAERILDARYASGEIDDHEYRHRLAVLRGTDTSDP